MPAAATPQVHHGLPLPSWRELKKCRITGPMTSTMATISQLKSSGEEQRVVIAQHQEDDGQRQIIIVHRALFAELAPARIRLLAGNHRGDRLLLIRNDDDEDVGHHDGADDARRSG